MNKVISIFAASTPFGPPLTRTCASCTSWNVVDVLCENGMPNVLAATTGCTDHQTDGEFWHKVDNPDAETAGMRHALKLLGDIRESIDDHAKRQVVYSALISLVQVMVADASTEARSKRLVGFVDLMTPVIAAGLPQLGMEEAHA